MKRGDIYFVKPNTSNNHGYTVWTGRPAVILSNDRINAQERAIEVVFLTSSPKQFDSDLHVSFQCRDRNAVALCEQVTTLDASQLAEYVMHVPDDVMEKIANAVCKSLGLCDRCAAGTVDTSKEKHYKAEAERWKQLYIEQMRMTAEVLK